ncbi:MAG: DMT family transporter [Spirochaetaceae bacterium]|jgi:transporter family-2 protein|nr:DMT family transporter [Spirochaetaceae bacterium]
MYKLFASLIGVVIALMLTVNGVLAGKVGTMQTLPFIHVAGLVSVSLLLIFRKEKVEPRKIPLILNSAGLIGVFLVLLNNRCFESLGASLTLSLGILGQTIGSLLADSTGFLGVKKYKFDKRKYSGLFLLILGVVVMTESWKGDLLNISFAFIAGVLVILSMIINSQLSLSVGIFHGVQRNYLVGLIGSIIVLIILKVPLLDSLFLIPDINPILLIGGGLLGVLVVAGINKTLPRIPVVYTTLLIFAGQAVAGILIDLFVLNEVSFRKVTGVLIILSGLFLNMMIDRSVFE